LAAWRWGKPQEQQNGNREGGWAVYHRKVEKLGGVKSASGSQGGMSGAKRELNGDGVSQNTLGKMGLELVR
jgi:hypothetical protein